MRILRPGPLTKAGGAVVALGLFLAVAGVNSGVNLLFLLSAAMLSTVCASLFLAALSVEGLKVTRRLPAEVTAGEPFTGILLVEARTRMAGNLLHIEEEAAGETAVRFPAFLPGLGGERCGTAHFGGALARRGEYRFHHTEISSCFPFGLARAVAALRGAEERLIVYPRRGRLRASVPAVTAFWEQTIRRSTLLGNEGDEIRTVREFRRGDNPRRIHWRTSAKMAGLYVREMEPEQQPSVTLVLNAWMPRRAAPERRERFELAVSFAATLAEQVLNVGGAVSLAALGPEPTVVVNAIGAPGRRAILSALAVLQPSPRPRHEDLLRRATPVLERSGAVVAIALDDDDLDAVAPLWPAGVRPARQYVVGGADFEAVFEAPAEATP